MPGAPRRDALQPLPPVPKTGQRGRDRDERSGDDDVGRRDEEVARPCEIRDHVEDRRQHVAGDGKIGERRGERLPRPAAPSPEVPALEGDPRPYRKKPRPLRLPPPGLLAPPPE